MFPEGGREGGREGQGQEVVEEGGRGKGRGGRWDTFSLMKSEWQG